jgi:anaerobic glycerol-3-phosphate dehydrogenase
MAQSLEPVAADDAMLACGDGLLDSAKAAREPIMDCFIQRQLFQSVWLPRNLQ